MNGDLHFCLTSLVHDHAWWSADQLAQTPGARRVAVTDGHADLREKMRQKFDGAVDCCADVDEMLDRARPDALIITAPNPAVYRTISGQSCPITVLPCTMNPG